MPQLFTQHQQSGMIDDRDDQQERNTLSNSNSDNHDNDGQYSLAGFNDAVDNDSISEGIKNNDPVGTRAPSPLNTEVDVKMDNGSEEEEEDRSATKDNDGGDAEDEEEEEEYETSYAKLQKLRSKYGAPNTTVDTPQHADDTRGDEETEEAEEDDTNLDDNEIDVSNKRHRHRRRRGGYGSSNQNNAAKASSVLESLNDNGAAVPHNDVELNIGDDENFDEDSWNLENLDLVDEDMMLLDNDADKDKSNLFMEEEEEEDDDDDATRPYDDHSGADDNGNDNEDVENEEDTPETTEEGRTKQKRQVIQREEVDDDATVANDEGENEEDEEENKHGRSPDHEPSDHDVEQEQEQEQEEDGPPNPTKKQVLAIVDKFFNAIANKDTMTVGGVLSYVADHFGFEDKKALGKERKYMIKERLTTLIQGKSKPEEKKKTQKTKKKQKKQKKHQEDDAGVDNTKEAVDDDDQYSEEEDDVDDDEDDAGGNDSSSDYEEAAPAKKRRGKKSRKTKVASDDDDSSDDSDASFTKKQAKRKKRRSKGSAKKGKMKNHLRDEATKRRLRQMEEARIRQEELGHLADDDKDDENAADSKSKIKSEEEKKASAGPQLSEQDKQRAMAIAARFDTNREELRAKREEDRVGLIGKLRQRRLESIVSKEFLAEDTSKKVSLADESNKDELEKEEEENNPAVKNETLTLTASVAPENDDGSDVENKGGMIELDDDDSDDDSDDEELEIAAPMSAPVNIPSTRPKSKSSTFDSLLTKHGNDAVRRPIVPQKKSKSVAGNPRMALRMALRKKQVQAGNRWLARELGYKTEEDHIRDCKDVEDKKRKQIFLMEKEAAMREEKNIIRDVADSDDVDELHFDNNGGTENYDEEDDEMAMARELNQLEEESLSGDAAEERDDDAYIQNSGDVVHPADSDEKTDNNLVAEESNDNGKDTVQEPSSQDGNSVAPSPSKATSESERTIVTPTASNSLEQSALTSQVKEDAAAPAGNENALETDIAINELEKLSDEPNDVAEGSASAQEDDTSSPPVEAEETGPKKPRNSGWQAMLRKEKEDLAKQKRRQKKGGGLVEGEAEEEEEEEGIVGLEDFGFAVQKKKGDDDDDVDDAEVDEDDLEHVVDDLSDGEGDEEAGEAARKRLEAKEEKERHKEIMRRMREGYSGRDRGIASGIGGARGMHRFDVLVGADNRDEAKQLGLLNDDELDSDDEGEEKSAKKGDDEEEDEAALLDKMLKERFLHKQTDEFLEENFSEDDEDEEEEEGTGENKDGDEEEDKEQDRVAKRFAKRARMNRILEAYEGDSQFSRSRLIDEDESTQNDLKAIKTSLSRKRGSILIGDKTKDAKENNVNDSSKRQKGVACDKEDSNAPGSSRFLVNESSLSVALIANRNAGRKRKTTFLNGKQSNSFGRKNSTCSSKSVSLNHVVFMTGDSQSFSRMDSSSNSVMQTIKNSTSFTKKTSEKRKSSLWSKVCSKNF